MIRMHNVTKQYDELKVLNNLSFHLKKGEFAFLHGRSGSGKSTLLKLLYREIEADSGTIEINGLPITQIPKYQLRRQIGIIFQSYELIEQKTIFENVILAGKVLGKPKHEIEAETLRLLERVGLKDKINAFPSQLSGGQQQRVAIVRALLNKPSLILADEPTGNLDSQTANEIITLLYELHMEENITMLIVTHSEKLLASDASIWEMKNGDLYEQTSF